MTRRSKNSRYYAEREAEAAAAAAATASSSSAPASAPAPAPAPAAAPGPAAGRGATPATGRANVHAHAHDHRQPQTQGHERPRGNAAGHRDRGHRNGGGQYGQHEEQQHDPFAEQPAAEGADTRDAEDGVNRPKIADPDMVSYVRQIETALEDADDEEARTLLVSNVHKEIKAAQASLITNKHCSAILQQLLKASSADEVKTFFKSLATYYRFLIGNRYSSHVMETLFAVCAPLAAAEDEDEAAGADSTAVTSSVLTMWQEIAEVWTEYVTYPGASHALRAFIMLLSGHKSTRPLDGRAVRREPTNGQPQQPGRGTPTSDLPIRKEADYVVPAAFTRILESIVDTVLAAEPQQLALLARDPNGSPVLQLLMAVAGPSKAPTLIDHLFTSPVSDEAHTIMFDELIYDPVGSHVLEVGLQLCSDDQFDHVWQKCLLPNLPRLCENTAANFVVQQALASIRKKKQAVAAVGVLLPLVGDLMSRNRAAVVWQLAECLAKPTLVAEQGQFMQALLATARNVPHSPAGYAWLSTSFEVAWLSIWLLELQKGAAPASSTADPVLNVSSTGARLVHAMLGFDAPVIRDLLNSLLALTNAVLQQLCCHPWGSRHVMEPLAESAADLSWARGRLCATIKGAWAKLAVNKFGCFFVQKIFTAVDVKRKTTIVEELADESRALTANTFGKHVMHHCKVGHYMQQPDSWTAAVSRVARQQAVMKDVLTALPAKPSLESKDTAQDDKPQKSKSKKSAAADETKAPSSSSSTGPSSAATTRVLDPYLAQLGFGHSDSQKGVKRAAASRDSDDQVGADSSMDAVLAAIASAEPSAAAAEQGKKKSSKKRRTD